MIYRMVRHSLMMRFISIENTEQHGKHSAWGQSNRNPQVDHHPWLRKICQTCKICQICKIYHICTCQAEATYVHVGRACVSLHHVLAASLQQCLWPLIEHQLDQTHPVWNKYVIYSKYVKYVKYTMDSRFPLLVQVGCQNLWILFLK